MDRTENDRESRNRFLSGMIYLVGTRTFSEKYHAKYYFLFEIFIRQIPLKYIPVLTVIAHIQFETTDVRKWYILSNIVLIEYSIFISKFLFSGTLKNFE